MNRFQQDLKQIRRQHAISPWQVVALVVLALAVGALVGAAVMKSSLAG